MLRVGLLICLSAACACAAPQGEHIEQLMESALFGTRYSNNIQEDANLKVPELLRKYGYPAEEHWVTTPDGYVLGLHRIPHGRAAPHARARSRPVVFVMHGLFSSSADFVFMGPGTSLSYILADEGYDVWLGNARGNHYSRKHLTLNPDAILNTAFWNFSWDEIGHIDLPAMIDYVLEQTGKDKLHYIGHSQGTTSFFVMGSLRPDYNKKIISMQALAPVAYLAHSRNHLFRALAPYSKDLSRLATFIGLGELFPNNQLMTWAGETFCKDEVVVQPICSSIMFLFGGWNEAQFNATMLPVIFGHTPAGSSVRQLAHYGQSIQDRGFRRFDHGSFKNLRIYGRLNPPAYDLSKVTAPVFLHYSDSDELADVRDVTTLFHELGAPVGKFRITMASFSHIDFVYAIDANTLLYDRVINLMRAMDARG